MSIVLKYGKIISGDQSIEADLKIENGKIVKIGENLSGDKEINCEGKIIFPGIIDTHVHFRTPGITHKADSETESKAALAGGVTTIFDMPNTNPQTITVDILNDKKKIYESTCLVNFGLMIGAAKDNIDELKKADNLKYIPSIKLFMAESTGEMTLYEEKFLHPVFRETQKMISVHAEDENSRLDRLEKFKSGVLEDAKGLKEDDPYLHSVIRDNKTTALGTKHAVDLAIKYSHRIHILHASAQEEFEHIKRGIEAGFVSAETCPHYLWFNREDINKENGWYLIMNPALKGKKDSEALWAAIKDGTINQIATDHAPHLLEEKKLPYGKGKPAGLPGIQFSLPLLLDAAARGTISLNQLVRLMAENPATNYGIKNKGYLKEGFDADITVIDPNKEIEINNDLVLSKCKWTPYQGMKLKGGCVEKTFVNGELMFDQGEIVGEAKGRNIEIT